MKLAKQAFLVTLTLLALMVSMSAQTLRAEKDPRNIAPTVGTGGPVGGPTGLFTVYDGQTLRRGEFTFSAAYSNYDRDPGNVDITEVPLSFQIGLNDYLELFFNVDGFRGIKVNAPRHLSSFYLPNSQFRFGNTFQTAPAIIMAPQGAGASQYPGFAIFRPQGSQPFAQFPYVGASAGNFGFFFPSGPIFGFPANSVPTLGPPRAGGAADNFPGIGSIFGSILPGIVLQTTCTAPTPAQCTNFTQAPTVFTLAPTYLPDAPFINRTYGTSAFSTFTAGAKWRWTGPDNPIGVGILGYYKWFADKADDPSGFNQLQRGASPGGNWGDIGLVLFADARLRRWANVSANVGYNYTSKVKGEFPGGEFTMLDRPDELMAAIGLDFPVNRYFQPILEFRSLYYMGGRTPNAFENNPLDGIAGVRIFPARWLSIGAAYRHHFNQQDADSFEDNDFTGNVTVTGRVPASTTVRFQGVPPGFSPSTDPHGFIFQLTAGRRNARQGDIPRQFANVEAVDLSTREIVVPCPPDTRPAEGVNCPDGTTINVGTRAVDPEGGTLVYQYTVSGGRIVGSGANVTWDLSGVRPGTYTITAAVDNGCGFCGRTVTETITVRECGPCVKPCVCPTLSVSGGGQVEEGEQMFFTASATGGTAANITYNWTVSNGRIASGQGTPSITVDTTGVPGNTNITATVRISTGDPACVCDREASETGFIRARPVAEEIDQFGRLSNDEVRARLDEFFRRLANDPNAQGYIINYGPTRQVTQRETLIRNHIAFRGFDPSRITIVRGGDDGGEVRTRLFLVPAGATPPNP